MTHLDRLRNKIKRASEEEPKLTPRFYSNSVNKEEQEARQKAMEQSAMTSMPAVPEAKPVEPSNTEAKKETEMTITVRKKEAEEEDSGSRYPSTMNYMPAFMLGGAGLGAGVGELSALRKQLPMAEDYGRAIKTQQLLEPTLPYWRHISRGKPYEEVMENLKNAPQGARDAIDEAYDKVRQYMQATESIPKLKEAIRKSSKRGRILGVGGGLGAGILLATALGAFDKKKPGMMQKESAMPEGYEDATMGAGAGSLIGAAGGGALGGILAGSSQQGKDFRALQGRGQDAIGQIKKNLREEVKREMGAGPRLREIKDMEGLAKLRARHQIEREIAQNMSKNKGRQAQLLNQAKDVLKDINRQFSKHKWKGRGVGAALGLGTGALAGAGLAHWLKDSPYYQGEDDALFALLER